MQRPLRALIFALCVVVAAVGTALFFWPKPAAKHVVLVVLDTLRADRMSVYGYAQETTPFLQESESQYLKFTRAKATAPWTMPSHSSIFTGLMPAVHQAQWGRIRLKPEFTTVAEVLRENGFSTVSLAANPFFGETFGLTQGFDSNTVVEGPARYKTEKILADLSPIFDQGLQSGKRLFVFLNLMDTHIPYNHHQYGRQFGLEDRPPIRNAKDKWKVNAGESELGPKEKKDHGAAYDAAVRYLDDVAAEIVGLLQEKNMLDQTLLIFTSDHGEGLGYHQELGHSVSVWEEQLAIPLLVRFPNARRGGQVVSTPVSLAGLAPFILDSLKVKRPEAMSEAPSLEEGVGIPVGADYRSYFGDTKRATNVEMAEVYPVLVETVRSRHVVYCGDNKLVIDDRGRVGFYNLENDPHEQHDLSGERPSIMEPCIEQHLDLQSAGRFTAFSNADTPVEIDEDQSEIEFEALRALGYVH